MSNKLIISVVMSVTLCGGMNNQSIQCDLPRPTTIGGLRTAAAVPDLPQQPPAQVRMTRGHAAGRRSTGGLELRGEMGLREAAQPDLAQQPELPQADATAVRGGLNLGESDDEEASEVDLAGVSTPPVQGMARLRRTRITEPPVSAAHAGFFGTVSGTLSGLLTYGLGAKIFGGVLCVGCPFCCCLCRRLPNVLVSALRERAATRTQDATTRTQGVLP